jgi:hypothetical protein
MTLQSAAAAAHVWPTSGSFLPHNRFIITSFMSDCPQLLLRQLLLLYCYKAKVCVPSCRRSHRHPVEPSNNVQQVRRDETTAPSVETPSVETCPLLGPKDPHPNTYYHRATIRSHVSRNEASRMAAGIHQRCNIFC